MVLAQAGYEVTVIDDLSNGHAAAVERAAKLSGQPIQLVEADLNCCVDDWLPALHDLKFDAVVHCAGLKSVSESVANPLLYYDVNVGTAVRVFEAMQVSEIPRLLFSSSATVYSPSAEPPFAEDSELLPSNPYGRTKLVIESMIADLVGSQRGLRALSLRYFNPVGAHESGLIGEDPRGDASNLMPILLGVIAGEREHVVVFGNDYPTDDGTCVRDYIHVMDLAVGHSVALDKLWHTDGYKVYNLGTGRGYSVLEMIATMSAVAGRPIPHVIGPRRHGDVAKSVANVDRAHSELGWKATRSLTEMCRDSLHWRSAMPRGYAEGQVG
jgi:UDP-glucose 4-epimerase